MHPKIHKRLEDSEAAHERDLNEHIIRFSFYSLFRCIPKRRFESLEISLSKRIQLISSNTRPISCPLTDLFRIHHGIWYPLICNKSS